MVAIPIMIIRTSYKRARSPNFLRKTNKLYFHDHLFLGSSKKKDRTCCTEQVHVGTDLRVHFFFF